MRRRTQRPLLCPSVVPHTCASTTAALRRLALRGRAVTSCYACACRLLGFNLPERGGAFMGPTARCTHSGRPAADRAHAATGWWGGSGLSAPGVMRGAAGTRGASLHQSHALTGQRGRVASGPCGTCSSAQCWPGRTPWAHLHPHPCPSAWLQWRCTPPGTWWRLGSSFEACTPLFCIDTSKGLGRVPAGFARGVSGWVVRLTPYWGTSGQDVPVLLL
jgi:hypothetical protein